MEQCYVILICIFCRMMFYWVAVYSSQKNFFNSFRLFRCHFSSSFCILCIVPYCCVVCIHWWAIVLAFDCYQLSDVLWKLLYNSKWCCFVFNYIFYAGDLAMQIMTFFCFVVTLGRPNVVRCVTCTVNGSKKKIELILDEIFNLNRPNWVHLIKIIRQQFCWS